MSTNKNLEKYKQLYSRYVEARINLHNYHIVFINNLGLESSIAVRKNLTEMEKLEKAMKMACRAAYLENLEIKRAEGKVEKLRKQTNRNTDGLKSKHKKKEKQNDNN
jgi:hypothetical protein